MFLPETSVIKDTTDEHNKDKMLPCLKLCTRFQISSHKRGLLTIWGRLLSKMSKIYKLTFTENFRVNTRILSLASYKQPFC